MTLSPARRALLGTALALTLTFAGAAQAQTAMKLASATINDVQHEWQKEFAAEMEARMPGALTVEIYPASQLGAIPRMIEGVQFGTIEAFTTPTSFVTTIDPRFQAFEVPGLFHSPEEVDAVIHDPDYRDHLETLFLDKGVRVIGAIYNSPTLLLSKEPVTDVADFEGMKIRTFASPLQMKPMEAVGALPTPIALSEVPVQLQSGGIDGMLAGMPILTAFQYWDSAKYVTDLNFAEIVSVTLVNEDWFQSQPADVQEAIRAAGRAAEETAFPWGVQNVQNANASWTEHGGEIQSLPDDEQQALMTQFAEVGMAAIADQPEVMAEYDTILGMLQEQRGR